MNPFLPSHLLWAINSVTQSINIFFLIASIQAHLVSSRFIAPINYDLWLFQIGTFIACITNAQIIILPHFILTIESNSRFSRMHLSFSYLLVYYHSSISAFSFLLDSFFNMLPLNYPTFWIIEHSRSYDRPIKISPNFKGSIWSHTTPEALLHFNHPTLIPWITSFSIPPS